MSPTLTLSSSTGKYHSRKKQPIKVRTIVQEYIFASKYEASPFRTMYLVLQSVGSELIHLYNAFEFVNIRSGAHVGEHRPSHERARK